MTKVSICIPTYNGAQYLVACLDSVLGQTYKNIEILVVDDQSTDTTFEILERYAARDQRIQLIRNERNLGLVENWNRCVELATGEWIKFLFQDDLLEPTCLAKMIASIQEGDLFVACGRKFSFETHTTEKTKEFYHDHKKLINQIYANKHKLTPLEFSDMAVERIGANLIGEPTVTLIHKSVFDRFGPFNKHLIMSCDLEYWIRIGIHTGVRFIPEELAVFRVHSQATSATNRRDRQYRMKILDSLSIWHDTATHPVYAPMRAAAARHSPPISLEQVMTNKAHCARVIAKHYDKHNESDRDALTQEWESFVKLYPRFKVSGLRHIFWSVCEKTAYKAAKIQAELL